MWSVSFFDPYRHDRIRFSNGLRSETIYLVDRASSKPLWWTIWLCAQVGVGLLPEGQGVQFVLLEAISFSSLLGRIPGAVGWARSVKASGTIRIQLRIKVMQCNGLMCIVFLCACLWSRNPFFLNRLVSERKSLEFPSWNRCSPRVSGAGY